MANSANSIKERLKSLRQVMKAEKISAFMIPTSDFHDSEYVGEYFKVREFFSGFTGSNGTLVVMQDFAGLWTDGRYFVQAQIELDGTGIILFKMGQPDVPTISDYISETLDEGDTFAFDGRCVCAKEARMYKDKLAKKQINLRTDLDPADSIWLDRPAISCSKIYKIPDYISGETAISKIQRIRHILSTTDVKTMFISKLDEIMWVLNLRASDIECNPVALSYLYIGEEKCALFVQKRALDDELVDYLSDSGVNICDYHEVYSFLVSTDLSRQIYLDSRSVNYRIYELIDNRTVVHDAKSPIEDMKSIKNTVELENIRRIYIEDSVALTRYIYWLKNNADTNSLDEYTAAKVLDKYREEIPGFIELSFPTIGAYAENAAIIHYEPHIDNAKKLEKKGMYLVDSGAQYMGGTTDVTRTIVLGEITDEIRKNYTLTVAGMLKLADAVFANGCTGRNLDIIARDLLWRNGLDYRHGTGHGIGYILNVHEGPQSIRYKYLPDVSEAYLLPGMIVSDEPGLYIDGEYGIRIENILEVKEKEETEYGAFYQFAHLTWVPIDLEGIDTEFLDEYTTRLLNEYHAEVYKRIAPFLNDSDEIEWLKKVTSPID